MSFHFFLDNASCGCIDVLMSSNQVCVQASNQEAKKLHTVNTSDRLHAGSTVAAMQRSLGATVVPARKQRTLCSNLHVQYPTGIFFLSSMRLLPLRVALFFLCFLDWAQSFCLTFLSGKTSRMSAQTQDCAAASKNKAPFVKVSVVEIKPDRVDEFVNLCKISQAASPKGEPGCIRLDILTVQGSTNKFIVYEIFDDEDAYQHHVDQPYSQNVGAFVKSGGVASDTDYLANGLFLTE